jgi:hypothetical protein
MKTDREITAVSIIPKDKADKTSFSKAKHNKTTGTRK